MRGAEGFFAGLTANVPEAVVMINNRENKNKKNMWLKWIFDRVVALIGLLVLWPVLLIVAVLVKVKMPGGPAFFVQKRVALTGDCLSAISSAL